MTVSSTTRQVALRKRPDLEIHPHQYAHERFWVVKDPVALNYFHLRDEEHAILEMLDGRTSFDEIKRRFEEMFAPLRLSFDQLHAFLGRLYRTGLVVADAPDQGTPLLARFQKKRRRGYLQAATSLLAIRFPGIDPDPLLNWLYPSVRWLFSRWALICCGLLVAGAVLVTVVRYDELLARLPDFGAFFNVRNMLLLALALAVVKVIHELGHALTCKHFGGECHELGLMLLVFTPCLYCNVSDSWMLASKWKRISISLAGVVVEIVLAAICAYLWWFSEPGLLNTLLLNMMFICTVNTLLFNGNPLLRYDGYYVLADLMEVPNLGQQSRSLVTHYLGKWFLGMPSLNDRALPDSGRWRVAFYGVAAMIYRVFIVFLILWFCYRLLQPYGLAVGAQLLALFVFTGLVMMPIWSLVNLARDPNWRGRIEMKRVFVSGCGLAVVLSVVCLVPLPHRIVVPAAIRPEDARRVYVSVPGIVSQAVEAGAWVDEGDCITHLTNADLRQQFEQLSGQRDQQQSKLNHLELRHAADPDVGVQIPVAREALSDITEQLKDRQRDMERLRLNAPISGTVLPATQLPSPYYRANQLVTWHGSPLEERNRGCFLDTGRLVCLIGDPERLEAVLVVGQAHIKEVREGQKVRIRLDQVRGGVITGYIAEISQTPLEAAPPELALSGRLAVNVEQDNIPRPAEPSYEARVVLDKLPPNLLIGTSGHAKILATPRTLASRVVRFVKRTFHFEL
jgi:putative peptide zinc metalloprotease protein